MKSRRLKMSRALREHIEKITPLSDEEFDYILSHFTSRKLKKKQFLLQVGDPARNDHFVLKGLLKLYTPTPREREYILQFAMEDWWICDYQSYFNQTPATLEIDCIEDVEVLCLSLQNRDKLCAELRKIEHFFMRKSNGGYMAMQRRILSLHDNNAKQG